MKNKIKMISGKDIKFLNDSPKLLTASKGDFKGEIDLHWDAVNGSIFYIIQISVYSGLLKWTQFDIISKSNYTISGLRSGKRYCFRVAAVSSSGKGSWSEIICKTAP